MLSLFFLMSKISISIAGILTTLSNILTSNNEFGMVHHCNNGMFTLKEHVCWSNDISDPEDTQLGNTESISPSRSPFTLVQYMWDPEGCKHIAVHFATWCVVNEHPFFLHNTWYMYVSTSVSRYMLKMLHI